MSEDKLTIKISKKKEDKPINLEEPNKPPKKVKIVLSKEELNTKEELNNKPKREKITKEEISTNTKEELNTKPKIAKEEGDTISMASSLLQLKDHCKQLGIKGISKKNKTELLEIIKNHN